ncbi:MAG: methyl-accepting chemotaxis protein [Peptococcaceae bacterium]|nr:methyl-accepting chemotaxis protein [Peptococcaceae bacterium]
MGKMAKTGSIASKMSLYTAMLITFLMVAVGTANYFHTRVLVESQAHEKGWSIVRSSTSFAAEHMQAGNPDLLREHMQHVLANGDISYAAIINAAGKIVSHTDPGQIGKETSLDGGLPAQNTVSVYTDAAGKRAGYDFIAPIITKGGSVMGYIRLGIDSQRYEKIIRDFLMHLLYISLASILAGIMLARVLAGQILKQPIQDLKEATEHIAAGNFTHRAPVRQLDELGGLALAFNSMTGHLANLFMSVRTSAAELTKSTQVILNRSQEFRNLAENAVREGTSGTTVIDLSNRRQMEALQDITVSAKKVHRLVDRLNALSLQFKV